MRLCVLYGSHKKTAIISLYSIHSSVFIIETESVYCAVRTGPSTQTGQSSSLKG